VLEIVVGPVDMDEEMLVDKVVTVEALVEVRVVLDV
jgi:hypothetical protein